MFMTMDVSLVDLYGANDEQILDRFEVHVSL